MCRNVKEMGTWFHKEYGGVLQTLKPMGKIQMSKGKPIKLSTTHFFFLPTIYFYHKLVEEVISLGWERYGGQIQIGKTTHFGKKCIFA